MDLRKLKKLIDLVEESGIAEIEVTEGEEKVRITRSLAAPQPVYAAAPAVAAAPAPGGDSGKKPFYIIRTARIWVSDDLLMERPSEKR